MNVRIKPLCSILACFALFAATPTAKAGGVAVGQSVLINKLDYSDTFTETANGGEAGAPDGTYPVPAAGLAVENTYGNPAQSWTSGDWSINQDSTAYPASPYPYPGTSGAGSATGMTQTGNGVDYGIAYGLRKNYVVQFDAVQVPDRIDITSSDVKNGIASDGNSLSVFFRAANTTSPFTQIALYNPVAGETTVGVASGIALYDTWNNYAVNFDQADNLLKIYTNQNLLATVNLATFDGGAYENYSNAFVNVGGSSFLWSDNFQVGAEVPEPSPVVALTGIGLFGALGLLIHGRRRSRPSPQAVGDDARLA